MINLFGFMADFWMVIGHLFHWVGIGIAFYHGLDWPWYIGYACIGLICFIVPLILFETIYNHLVDRYHKRNPPKICSCDTSLPPITHSECTETLR